jgi:hypothetical protein
MLEHIGNADQTPVYSDIPSNVIVNEKGAKTVLIRETGNEKARITVMLGVLTDGHKLSPYVILQRKRMPKEKLAAGLVFRCQQKGTLLNKCGMLVLDSFKGHLTLQVKEEMRKANTDLVVIPGEMTSQLQELDVVIKKPFKAHLRQHYNDWLLEGNHALTPSGKLKKPSVTMLGEWILTAWGRISSESILAGFKKCCISNALDGTEDDFLRQDVAHENDDGDCEDDGDEQRGREDSE